MTPEEVLKIKSAIGASGQLSNDTAVEKRLVDHLNSLSNEVYSDEDDEVNKFAELRAVR